MNYWLKSHNDAQHWHKASFGERASDIEQRRLKRKARIGLHDLCGGSPSIGGHEGENLTLHAGSSMVSRELKL